MAAVRYPGLTLADLGVLADIGISGVFEKAFRTTQQDMLTRILRTFSVEGYMTGRSKSSIDIDPAVDAIVMLFMLPSWEITPKGAQDVMRKIVRFEVELFGENTCEDSILAKALETISK